MQAPQCFCNREARRFSVRRRGLSHPPGTPFFRCAKSIGNPARCEFFVWEHELLTPGLSGSDEEAPAPVPPTPARAAPAHMRAAGHGAAAAAAAAPPVVPTSDAAAHLEAIIEALRTLTLEVQALKAHLEPAKVA